MKEEFRQRAVIALLVAVIAVCRAEADDWPMWRHDAARSASTSEELPGQLSLRWTLHLGAPAPAWPEDPRLGFDASYEPIILGPRLIVASNRDDSVTAFDIETAGTLWRFWTDGPVRLAPVGAGDRVFVGSDDGSLYCVGVHGGRQIWRLDPMRSRKVLGNSRLISALPVRGGPVVANGHLHYTSGVWPFEGTFLWSVDLERSATRPRFSVISLTGDDAPQGYLAMSGDRVLIPAGRAKVASVEPGSGHRDRLAYDSKGFTDWHATASGDRWIFHGRKVIDRERNTALPIPVPRPVSDGSRIWYGDRGAIRGVDLSRLREVTVKDRRGKDVVKLSIDGLWKLDNEDVVNAGIVRGLRAAGPDEDRDALYRAWLEKNPMVVALKAGSRLYGYQRRTLFALDLTDDGSRPGVSWRAGPGGRPTSMLAGAGRLLAVTAEGDIHCFGPAVARPGEVSIRTGESLALPGPGEESAEWARTLLESVTEPRGHAVVLGAGDGALVGAILAQSALEVIVLESDRAVVEPLRRRLDAAGLYGNRVTVITAEGALSRLPPYLAVLVTTGDAGRVRPDASIGQLAGDVFRVLRPYGGLAGFALPAEQHAALRERVARGDLEGAVVTKIGSASVLQRAGALPGSADWTREYGDEGNTLMSRDRRVRPPFGVLWFGGPAGDAGLFYNRHNWPPSATVRDGRMVVQGPGVLAAVDVYTGRILWRRLIVDGGGSPGRRSDITVVSGDRQGNPGFGLPPAGFNFLHESDAIYLAYPGHCLLLDPRSGDDIGQLELLSTADEWGRIRVWKDLLLVSVLEARNYAEDKQRLPLKLVAMDRHSGELRWVRRAKNAFPFVAFGRGRIVALDARLENLYRDKRRANGVPEATGDRLLVGFDAASGEERWSVPIDMVAAWLSFSSEHDIVVASNSEEIRAFHGSNGYTLWSRKAKGVGFRGHPENLVHKVILWHDRVIDQRGPGLAYDLRTGEALTTRHPLTREPVAWEFTKIGHHCNYAIASEHLLTFRAATAGYLDLETGGTSHLPGFRSGCRNSLIPANGVLNAPNFANGCICSYSIFTSLALVHRPENDMWAYSAFGAPSERIERVGINLGAPGDRRSAEGTLWIDHPRSGGPSPVVDVSLAPETPRWFAKHSGLIKGEGLPWVCGSGARGLSSITVRLEPAPASPDARETGQEAERPRPHTVRLAFLESEDRSSGETVFSVKLQGRTVLQDFDPVEEAGGPDRGLVREFTGILVGETLTVDLIAREGETTLSGVEIVAE